MQALPSEVRPAVAADSPGIRSVLQAAFGEAQGDEIGQLVSDLTADAEATPQYSLVAERGDRVLGHVLFTPVELSNSSGGAPAQILAPLAVHPDAQGQGIGGQLIAEGLRRAGEDGGAGLVFVLGDPGYYRRHGFISAQTHGLAAPYPIPAEHAEAWMVQELRPGVLEKASGVVECAAALMEAKHWVE